MTAAYFDQFNIVSLITIRAPFLGDFAVSFTNSSLMMLSVITVF